MTLLLSHSLSPEAQRQFVAHRVSRRAKAVLSILRVKTLLGLTDADLLFAVAAVMERDVAELGREMFPQYQTEEMRSKQ